MQIVGDDHTRVAARRVGPRPRFEIGTQRIDALNLRKRRDRFGVAVDGIDLMPARREPARVPAAAARDVENTAALGNESGPALDPCRGCFNSSVQDVYHVEPKAGRALRRPGSS